MPRGWSKRIFTCHKKKLTNVKGLKGESLRTSESVKHTERRWSPPVYIISWTTGQREEAEERTRLCGTHTLIRQYTQDFPVRRRRTRKIVISTQLLLRLLTSFTTWTRGGEESGWRKEASGSQSAFSTHRHQQQHLRGSNLFSLKFDLKVVVRRTILLQRMWG